MSPRGIVYEPISTKEEAGQYHLARAARMQAPQYRYGQQHDMEVYNDARYRTPEEPPVAIPAVPWGFREPAFAHRGALKDG